MSQDLKQKTATSLLWNAADKVGFQIVALIVAIITARLLTPTDFGYIGALALFTILSNTLVESGFTAALVRRENNTQADYSAAFYFNIGLSILFYLILFFFAPTIARYFKMPELVDLSRFLFIAIIINSFGIIQTIVLTKELAFKSMTSANLIAVTLSGVITIILALNGFGYWAIAWQQITQVLFRIIILWILSSWRPSLKANFKVIKELFAFSSYLLISNISSNCVKYVYNFFIGPRYSSADLGYYAQAFKFHLIPSNVITNTLTGVAYPVISSLNKEPERQLLYLRKIMRIGAFLAFPITIALYLLAPDLFSVVLSDKWLPAVPYFKLLIWAVIMVPFFAIALNTITALGYSRLTFILSISRDIMMLIFIFILNQSIEVLIYGFLLANLIATVAIIIVLTRVTKYTILGFLKDIFPYAAISMFMAVCIILFHKFVPLSAPLRLISEIIIGIVVYLATARILGSKIVLEIKSLLTRKTI